MVYWIKMIIMTDVSYGVLNEDDNCDDVSYGELN